LIWVNRLEVPDGVLVSDRADSEIFEASNPGSPGPCEGSHYSSGGLSLRVFGELVPAGVAQYHLGTDIGNFLQGNASFDSRINVGVFNASATAASAAIEIRCSSESGLETGSDPLLATASVTVPPNSVVQQTVLSSTRATPCPLIAPAPYHVIVTSDRPGFSYAAALSNEAPPKFPGFSPLTF
jgi:hypothetical protein